MVFNFHGEIHDACEMKNKQNENEWELGVKTNSQGRIFVITHAKNGKHKKKNHKNEWEVKNKNKSHVEGMRNEESVILHE